MYFNHSFTLLVVNNINDYQQFNNLSTKIYVKSKIYSDFSDLQNAFAINVFDVLLVSDVLYEIMLCEYIN